MKSILNTLTKMNNAIGLATLCGAIASTAILAGSASAAPIKGMDKAYICAGLSGSITTEIDPRMTDELLLLLKSPDSNVRMKAANVLGSIDKIDPRMTDELLLLVKGPDSSVRMIAARALGRIGKSNPMVVDELLLLLKDPDSDVRMIAAQALGGISKSNPMVVDELLKWMKQP
jgi:HEAT repeat protein